VASMIVLTSPQIRLGSLRNNALATSSFCHRLSIVRVPSVGRPNGASREGLALWPDIASVRGITRRNPLKYMWYARLVPSLPPHCPGNDLRRWPDATREHTRPSLDPLR